MIRLPDWKVSSYNRTKNVISLGTAQRLLAESSRGRRRLCREKRGELGDSPMNDLRRLVATVVFIIRGAEIEVR